MSSAEMRPPDTAEVASVFPSAHDEPCAEDRVVIRSYSKIVIYFPTMLTALVCGALAVGLGDSVDAIEMIAATFMIVFFVNTVIVAFDFPRMTAVAVVLLIVLLATIGNQYFSIPNFVATLLNHVHMQANAPFYFVVAGVFLFMFALSWIVTRFDYWVVMNNELLHKHGPFGDLERYPAPQLKLDKEIPDIFEYLFFRSGRLIFYPTSERRAYIVENVMNVNGVEQRIKHLLGALEVRVGPEQQPLQQRP